MKEQYLAEVAKRLNVPRSKRKEILRDLSEAFASAAEHGESEEQVVQRLGTPQDFVNSLAPFSPSTRKRWALAFGVTLGRSCHRPYSLAFVAAGSHAKERHWTGRCRQLPSSLNPLCPSMRPPSF